MTREPLLFLVDIVECCDLLAKYTKGVKESEFESDICLQDAIFRRVEIIGEATKNITNELKKKYSNVPWKTMAGMRDVLIHQYHGIRLDETWMVVKKDVPEVKKQIQKIIAELKKK